MNPFSRNDHGSVFCLPAPDLGALGKVLEIIVLNVILSGDNAVVIALACRGLPPQQRKLGIALGALVAVILRVFFTVVIASLLNTPFLRIAGALLLLWIAVKLLTEDPGRRRRHCLQ